MQLSPDGFVAAPNREMNCIKVDEDIFDHVGKWISQGDIVPIAGCSLSLPMAIGTGKYFDINVFSILGVE